MNKIAVIFTAIFIAMSFTESMAKDVTFYLNEVIFTEGVQKAYGENIPDAYNLLRAVEAEFIKNSLKKAEDSTSTDYVVNVQLNYESEGKIVMDFSFLSKRSKAWSFLSRIGTDYNELRRERVTYHSIEFDAHVKKSIALNCDLMRKEMLKETRPYNVIIRSASLVLAIIVYPIHYLIP
jgi:hypothetical protein